MGLTDEERAILVALESEKADKLIAEAEQIAALRLWDAVANRLYYAAFHAVSALLIKNKHAVNTHRGTVITFGNFFVKTGIVSKDEGKLYSQLQSIRESGDYNCYIETTEAEILPKIAETKAFVATIQSLLKKGEPL